jgi:hypothetical protein
MCPLPPCDLNVQIKCLTAYYKQFGYKNYICGVYLPYHSKYNPIERAFGWLEQHWSGSLLDSVDTVLQFASTLPFKEKNPVVTLVDKVYHTGVKLTEVAMAEVEQQIQRLPNLKKWFVEIFSSSA